MFKKVQKSREYTLLEIEFERTLSVMKTVLHESKEYAQMLNAAERLHEMMEKERETPSSVSRDTMANIGANLLGIIMIIKHEHVNVITSKALSFVTRLR